MFSLILQFIGILGGAVGIAGIFLHSIPTMITGLVLAFSLSFCKKGDLPLHFMSRLSMGPIFSAIGMLLTHFIGSVPWGWSLFYAAIFVYTIQAISWTVLRLLRYI